MEPPSIRSRQSLGDIEEAFGEIEEACGAGRGASN
jgi:hypothetical protein